MKRYWKTAVCAMLTASMFLTSCGQNGNTLKNESKLSEVIIEIEAESKFSSSDAESKDASSNSKVDSDSTPSKTDSSDVITSSSPSSEGQSSENQSSEKPSSENQSADIPVQTKPNNPNEIKYIAFTFDDGPSNTYTKKIIDKFASYGGEATFFVIGNRINDTAGANLQYAVSKGCEIGIHAYTHKYNYSKCTDERYEEELSKTANAIHKYLPDYDIKLMRPVGGSITSDRVASSKYSVINWNVDSNDWRHKKPAGSSSKVNTIYNNIVKNIKDGDIVLMHEIYQNSYDALCKALDKLYDDGYRFVTVTELIGESNLKPGKKYSRR